MLYLVKDNHIQIFKKSLFIGIFTSCCIGIPLICLHEETTLLLGGLGSRQRRKGGCDAELGPGVGSSLEGAAPGEQAGHKVLREGFLSSSLVLKVAQQL